MGGLQIFDSLFLVILLIIVGIWSMVWKGIALWRAGRNNDLTWFIFIFIFNTAGILPIIYLILNRKKQQEQIQ